MNTDDLNTQLRAKARKTLIEEIVDEVAEIAIDSLTSDCTMTVAQYTIPKLRADLEKYKQTKQSEL